MSAGLVVVGAGLAGAKAVQTIRDRGFSGDVTLIGEEPHHPYERPPLSKDYLQGMVARETLFVHPNEWYDEQNVDLILGTSVTSIDRQRRQITMGGQRTVDYEGLLLATGSRPNQLRVPGADLAGIHYLRRIDDSEALHTAFDGSPRLAIIGGGWIGLEVAAAARAVGLEVTLIEQAELPLVSVLGSELALVMADLHREHGVDLRLGTQVTEIIGANGHVTGVALGSGDTVSADLVLVGVGITPNTALAADCGLAVENGIVVDEHLRTSDPAICAAGDVANAYHPFLDRHIRVEHWANALHQPEVAALSLTGDDAVYDRLPFFYSDQYDLGLEYTGYVPRNGYDDVVIRGDVGSRQFIAFWMADGRVLAGMNVNVWDVSAQIGALIRSRSVVDKAVLADPSTPLDALTH